MSITYANFTNGMLDYTEQSNARILGYITPLKGNKLNVTTTVTSIVETGRIYGVNAVSAYDELPNDLEIEVWRNNNYVGRVSYYGDEYNIDLDTQVIYTSEHGNSDVPIQIGDELRIYEDYRIRPRIPRKLTFDPLPEYLTNRSERPEPINLKTPYDTLVTTVDKNSNVATITIPKGNVDNPWAVNIQEGAPYWRIYSPDGSIDSSNIINGAVISSSNGVLWRENSGETNTTITLPSGVHYLYYVTNVTLLDYSPTHFYRYYKSMVIIVHDDEFTPIEFTGTINSTKENGWSLDFDAIDYGSFSASDISRANEGTGIVFWGYPINSQTIIDNQINERVYFRGYINNDSEQQSGLNHTHTFNAVSVTDRLASISGYSNVFLNGVSPDSWFDSSHPNPSIGKVCHMLLLYYTNLLNIHTLNVDSEYNNIEYPDFYVQENTPLQQVQELLDAIDSQLYFHANGSISISPQLELVPLSNRDNIEHAAILTEDNTIDITVDTEHYSKIKQVISRAIIAGFTQPSFSQFPGNLNFGIGTDEIEQDNLISISDGDTAERNGRRAAKIDDLFFDSNGYFHRTPTIRVTLSTIWDVFDSYNKYTLIDYTTPDGLDLSIFKFILQSTGVTYENNTAQVTATFKAAPNAGSGTIFDKTPSTLSDGNFVEGIDSNQVVFSFGGFDLSLPDIDSPVAASASSRTNYINGLINNVFLLSDDGYYYFSSDFQTPNNMEWTQTSMGVSGTPYHFEPSPSNVSLGYLLTTTNLYEVEFDFNLGTATFTNRITFPDSSIHGSLSISTVEPTLGLCGVYYDSGAAQGARYYITTNGSTWSLFTTSGLYNSGSGQNHRPAFTWSHINDQRLYGSILESTSSFPDGQVLVSTNQATTTSKSLIYSAAMDNDPTNLSAAWQIQLFFDDLEDTTMLQCIPYINDTQARLYLVNKAGGVTHIPINFEGTERFCSYLPKPFTLSYITDTRGIVHSIDVGNSKRVCLITGDGINWKQLTNKVPAGSVGDCTNSIISGQYGTEIFLYGYAGSFYYSPNFGYSINDRGKQLRTQYPSVGAIIGITGDE